MKADHVQQKQVETPALQSSSLKPDEARANSPSRCVNLCRNLQQDHVSWQVQLAAGPANFSKPLPQQLCPPVVQHTKLLTSFMIHHMQQILGGKDDSIGQPFDILQYPPKFSTLSVGLIVWGPRHWRATRSWTQRSEGKQWVNIIKLSLFWHVSAASCPAPQSMTMHDLNCLSSTQHQMSRLHSFVAVSLVRLLLFCAFLRVFLSTFFLRCWMTQRVESGDAIAKGLSLFWGFVAL